MDYYKKIKKEFLDNKVYHDVKDYSKNKKDLETYFNVGKLLIEAQGGEARAKYGNKLIQEYSKKLTEELGKGYSIKNLKYMRKFYILSKSTALPNLLSWSHYCELLSLADINEINYYIYIAIEQNLSYRKLREKIKIKEYKRLPESTKNKIIKYEKHNIEDFIKNPIIIPNTSNNEKIDEKNLKYLILENLDIFLKELGNGFMYAGNEYKIKIGQTYNYIDLLLYNIEFNCYVVVELKVREFKKQDIGQIKLYMNYIDENLKKPTNNKTVGIIICKEKDIFVLKYVSEPNIFITKYITL